MTREATVRGRAASSRSNSEDLGEDDPLHEDSPARSNSPQSLVSLKHFVLSVSVERLSLLVMLLLLQSLSSVILNRFEGLLHSHVEVMLFLTMLVGAGGNAGNQSAVRVIRDLAGVPKGIALPRRVVREFLLQEALVGLVMSVLLGIVGFLRVVLFLGMSSFDSAFLLASVIAVSLILIVIHATVIGCSLPLILQKFGLDPAHAGPAVQVVMDILGVFITCTVASVMLPENSPSP